MRRLKLIFIALLALLPLQMSAAHSEGGELNVQEFIFGHIGDAYEWHITTAGEHHISIPLPCIVIDNGLKVFSSHKMEEHGYTLNEAGKLVNAQTLERPIDISITKNVVGLLFSAILLVTLILLCSKWYRKHDVLKEKPTGIAALLEPVIVPWVYRETLALKRIKEAGLMTDE